MWKDIYQPLGVTELVFGPGDWAHIHAHFTVCHCLFVLRFFPPSKLYHLQVASWDSSLNGAWTTSPQRQFCVHTNACTSAITQLMPWGLFPTPLDEASPLPIPSGITLMAPNPRLKAHTLKRKASSPGCHLFCFCI